MTVGAEFTQVAALMVQTVIFILGGAAMVVRTSASNGELREDIKAMQEELRGLTKVITIQAVHQQRLDEQSRRMTTLWNLVEDLRRGRGYVQQRDQDAGEVDREY